MSSWAGGKAGGEGLMPWSASSSYHHLLWISSLGLEKFALHSLISAGRKMTVFSGDLPHVANQILFFESPSVIKYLR